MIIVRCRLPLLRAVRYSAQCNAIYIGFAPCIARWPRKLMAWGLVHWFDGAASHPPASTRIMYNAGSNRSNEIAFYSKMGFTQGPPFTHFTQVSF
jgi:hypothetical protein